MSNSSSNTTIDSNSNATIDFLIGAGLEGLVEAIVIIGIGLLALVFFKWPVVWSDLKKIIKEWDQVSKDVHTIKVFLQTKYPEVALFQSKSPLALTESGQNIASTIGADTIADAYMEQVAISREMNPYEIQVTCFDFAEKSLISKLDAKTKTKIETEAFERGLEVENILKIIAIVIRDKFLSQRGYVPTQIDEHDPHK
ncbi:MAG: hypothetical protein V6Z81_04380 [Parvularculales bacterium]